MKPSVTAFIPELEIIEKMTSKTAVLFPVFLNERYEFMHPFSKEYISDILTLPLYWVSTAAFSIGLQILLELYLLNPTGVMKLFKFPEV